MAITRNAPNTIFLGGSRTQVGDLAAKAAITPGMLVEKVNTAGVHQWQKHSVAAGAGHAVATDHAMANKGVDDDYAAGDLVEVSILAAGATAWMILASGANIAFGAKLESAGNGKLRAWTNGVDAYVALETVDNSAGPGDARIRVEVV